jgi:hypothetical protein
MRPLDTSFDAETVQIEFPEGFLRLHQECEI